MIPKVIHQIWLGKGTMPDYRGSWQKHHPGWRLNLWTEQNRPKLQNEWLWSSVLSYAQLSDLLRYELLWMYGGVYVDVDFECLGPVDRLLGGDFVMAYENPRYLQNGFMAAVPGHPSIKRIIDEIPQRCQENVPESFPTGPMLIDHLRRSPAFNASIFKIPHGLIGSPGSVAFHRNLGSWTPPTQIIRRARTQEEQIWGSHLPMLTGLWRQVPGEVVVEAGVGLYATPFLVSTSLQYYGIETNAKFCDWAMIQLHNDQHAQVVYAPLPKMPQHRDEYSPEQLELANERMSWAGTLLPPTFDLLLVDCDGGARLSAILALASKATTVVLHDTECWDRYQYEAIRGMRPWKHRFSLRPSGIAWTDAFTMYPVDVASVRWAVRDYAAPQFWPPGVTCEFLDLSGAP